MYISKKILHSEVYSSANYVSLCDYFESEKKLVQRYFEFSFNLPIFF